MGDGETDADEPPGRRPLPPADRIWRHPAEVASDARRVAARNRSRRRRASFGVIGGIAAASGILWLAQTEPAVVATAEPASLGSEPRPAESGPPTTIDVTTAEVTTTVATTTAPTQATTTLTSTTLTRPDPEPEPEPDDGTLAAPLAIRSDQDSAPLAGAVVIRDGFLITSGQALGGLDDVVVTWGVHHVAGVVVGHDDITDVAVVQVDNHPPAVDLTAPVPLGEGAKVSIAEPGPGADIQTVVNAASASERIDGTSLVGIVELDGTLGDVPAGSPVFDEHGSLIGVLTATAADAPAAVVPIELVLAVTGEIIDLGAASHPWIGVRARNPDPSTDGPVAGSLITAVRADGPAQLGGIVAGDLVVGIDDEAVDSMESMVATLRSHEPGDSVTFVVERDGETVTCLVELDSWRRDSA